MKRVVATVLMQDGTEYEVRTVTADYVRYESTRRQKGWGTLQEDPATWEAYISYAALQRTKQISMPWEKFLTEVDIVDGVTEVLVPPTNQASGDENSSS